MLQINKAGWNEVAEQFFEGTKNVLSYGPYAPTEEELHLFGSIEGAVILEVGCGSGHTLEYLSRRGARELWGVDLSSAQIATAQTVTESSSTPVTLIEAPMEEIPGLPDAYFDKVISVYALGWTVDLRKTLGNIYQCLKPNGVFVFSWEHPMHSMLRYHEETFTMSCSYLQEGFITQESWRGVPIVMHHRKLSTFLNELMRAGFVIDQVVEECCVSAEDTSSPTQWYSGARAKMIPSTLIIKCHKR